MLPAFCNIIDLYHAYLDGVKQEKAEAFCDFRSHKWSRYRNSGKIICHLCVDAENFKNMVLNEKL